MPRLARRQLRADTNGDGDQCAQEGADPPGSEDSPSNRDQSGYSGREDLWLKHSEVLKTDVGSELIVHDSVDNRSQDAKQHDFLELDDSSHSADLIPMFDNFAAESVVCIRSRRSDLDCRCSQPAGGRQRE